MGYRINTFPAQHAPSIPRFTQIKWSTSHQPLFLRHPHHSHLILHYRTGDINLNHHSEGVISRGFFFPHITSTPHRRRSTPLLSL